jgi:hypothetical protein
MLGGSSAADHFAGQVVSRDSANFTKVDVGRHGLVEVILRVNHTLDSRSRRGLASQAIGHRTFFKPHVVGRIPIQRGEDQAISSLSQRIASSWSLPLTGSCLSGIDISDLGQSARFIHDSDSRRFLQESPASSLTIESCRYHEAGFATSASIPIHNLGRNIRASFVS